MGHNEDLQKLMNEGLAIARALLQDHGGFYPFALRLDPFGEIARAEPYRGDDDPPPEAMVRYLEQQMHEHVAAGMARCVAIFLEVRVGASQAAMDAVQMSAEHESGYASNFFVPYSTSEGKITLGQPFATERTPTVFC